ncbi:MAG: alpha/beta hydrolase [bacterium]|nr:alpha/beta hydrolase [bacterium]
MTHSRAALLAALTATSLALAGCAGDTKVRDPRPDSSGTTAPTDPSSPSGPDGTTESADPSGPSSQVNPDFDPAAGTDPALAAYYSQDVTWAACPDLSAAQCADITVPMDYANPDGETITISVNHNIAAGADKPTIFLNPGGPGGSGTDMLQWAPFMFLGVADEFNLAGFDPRGVQGSSAVECISDAELDARQARDIEIDTDEGMQAYVDDLREYAQKCEDNTGALLGFVDTDSAARDLDILRAVVARTEQLDYVGFSYGTFLGAVYADLFADRVGRFVLDAAVDPSISMSELAMGQAMGFDRAVRAFMDDCLAGPDCFHQGTAEDGLAKIQQLFEVAYATPLPTSDSARPLTASYAYSGVITSLYSVFYWPSLNVSLDLAINQGDGSGLLEMADTGNSRNPDGTFDGNSSEAFMAINCLDYPVEGTIEDWRAHAAQMAENYPVFGDSIAYSEVTCSNWPHASTRTREPIAASGSDPILVIGTTRDPATPYEWAVSLADQLENGHLVTYEGDGHTAFGQGNMCVDGYVNNFLLEGTLPPAGATC